MWREEFGSDYEVPAEVLERFEQGKLLDTSWHNDVSPSFQPVEKDHIRIWIDHPDPKKRVQRITPRFMVTIDGADGNIDSVDTFDDIGEALAMLDRVSG